jgi:hypothetical protein
MYFFIGSEFWDRVPQNVKPTTTTVISESGGSLTTINSPQTRVSPFPKVQKRSDAGIYLTGTNSTQYAALFHDVTTGNNSALEFDSSNNPVSVTGFSAGTNWDATTGLGSPVGSSVVDYLIANVTPSDG